MIRCKYGKKSDKKSEGVWGGGDLVWTPQGDSELIYKEWEEGNESETEKAKNNLQFF